jgi:hypothetical protein
MWKCTLKSACLAYSLVIERVQVHITETKSLSLNWNHKALTEIMLPNWNGNSVNEAVVSVGHGMQTVTCPESSCTVRIRHAECFHELFTKEKWPEWPDEVVKKSPKNFNNCFGILMEKINQSQIHLLGKTNSATTHASWLVCSKLPGPKLKTCFSPPLMYTHGPVCTDMP